jgi:hypothetical protein
LFFSFDLVFLYLYFIDRNGFNLVAGITASAEAVGAIAVKVVTAKAAVVGASASKVIATTGAYFWEDQAESNGLDTEPSPESNWSDTDASPGMSTAEAGLGGEPLEE